MCVFIGEQKKDKDIHDRDVEMLEQSDGKCFCSIFMCVCILFQFIEAINIGTPLINGQYMHVGKLCLPTMSVVYMCISF